MVVVMIVVVVVVVVIVVVDGGGRGGRNGGGGGRRRGVCGVALEVCWFLPCLGLVGESCVVVCAGFAVASSLSVSALHPSQVDL